MNDIRAIAFDVNGTLVDIRTQDDDEAIFRAAGHVLTYAGIDLRRHEVRDLYHAHVGEQRAASKEKHPEYDAVAAWARIVDEHATAFTARLPAPKREWLPVFLAEIFRGVSRHRLRLYPFAREVLDALFAVFPLAVVTDAQSAWALGELHHVGLTGYFDPVVVSGDHGFRKPDRRLFEYALDGLGVAAEHTLYVGNDMHRDIYGAREAGMRTALFVSEQGEKAYRDTVPDHIIDDHRELLAIVGLGA